MQDRPVVRLVQPMGPDLETAVAKKPARKRKLASVPKKLDGRTKAGRLAKKNLQKLATRSKPVSRPSRKKTNGAGEPRFLLDHTGAVLIQDAKGGAVDLNSAYAKRLYIFLSSQFKPR